MRIDGGENVARDFGKTPEDKKLEEEIRKMAKGRK